MPVLPVSKFFEASVALAPYAGGINSRFILHSFCTNDDDIPYTTVMANDNNCISPHHYNAVHTPVSGSLDECVARINNLIERVENFLKHNDGLPSPETDEK